MRFIDCLIKSGSAKCGWYDITNYLAMDPDGRVFGYEQKPTPNVIGWGIEDRKNSTDVCGCRMQLDVNEIDDDWNTCIVTREQYEAALATSQKVEWDGAGMPPVGLAIELRYAGDEWLPGILIAHGEEQIILKYDGGKEFSGHRNNYEFRPARSESDKKRDSAIEMMIDIFFNTPPAESPNEEDRLAMAQLYDAIASGKIPRIHID